MLVALGRLFRVLLWGLKTQMSLNLELLLLPLFREKEGGLVLQFLQPLTDESSTLLYFIWSSTASGGLVLEGLVHIKLPPVKFSSNIRFRRKEEWGLVKSLKVLCVT